MNSLAKATGMALLTFILGGTVARAADGAGDGVEQTKRHTAAMSQGMSHDEATKASTRTSDDGTANQEAQ